MHFSFPESPAPMKSFSEPQAGRERSLSKQAFPDTGFNLPLKRLSCRVVDLGAALTPWPRFFFSF